VLQKDFTGAILVQQAHVRGINIAIAVQIQP
jgi:hypothetical protein